MEAEEVVGEAVMISARPKAIMSNPTIAMFLGRRSSTTWSTGRKSK